MNELLFAAMLSLIPAKAQVPHGETVDGATARYRVIADAIAGASTGDATLAALLVTVARHESDFRRAVHSGKVRGDAGYSYGLYQVRFNGRHPGARAPRSTVRAFEVVGVDPASSRRAANLAAAYLKRAVKSCRARAECMFKYYGGVSKTTNLKVQGRIAARVKTYRRVRAFLASRATR